MSEAPAATRPHRVALKAAAAIAERREAGGAWILTVPEAPGSPMLNRIVGLGVGQPATECDTADALAAVPAGTTFYVGVDPQARPRDLSGWLHERGLEPGWGWMRFHRAPGDPPQAQTPLRLVEVASADDRAAFAHVVRESYELGPEIEPRLAGAPDAGWLCWVAYDADEPAAAAGLYVDEGVGYLGFAGTLAAHRGKGAQSALLARRIERAAELGCDLVITETGEVQDGRPGNSYRNILRAGFAEQGVTANWRGVAPLRP